MSEAKPHAPLAQSLGNLLRFCSGQQSEVRVRASAPQIWQARRSGAR
ncbi:MAG: hypothetical protein INR62_10250 [Rhodospirillales bacterium]|nr:hypothetical protein [Acetobacter sp.]